MDELLEKKTELLSLYYPGYCSDILRDILVSCSGDIDKAKALIEGPKAHKLFAAVQSTLTSHVKKEVLEKEEERKRKLPKLGELESSLTTKRVRPAPSESETGTANRVRAPQITLNTPEDVEKHLGRWALLELKFFPRDVADDLLAELAAAKDKFKTRQFYLFGNLCTLDVLTTVFAARDNDCPSLVYNGLPVAGANLKGPNEYSRRFETAAKYLEDAMNERVIPLNPRLPLQRKERWTAGFCVANRYQKMSNHLDWHSDRLSHIGPHNYIASVLLGLTRIFKLRSTYDPNGPVYLVPLPHNSLFIMKPGCQEEFKHTLAPMSRTLLLHPEVGSLRIGLTFRHYPADFIRNVPKCRCNIPMMLRRAFKSAKTKGTYYWLCENVYQNKECGTFHWADLSNFEGHFVAASVESASRWLADEEVREVKS